MLIRRVTVLATLVLATASSSALAAPTWLAPVDLAPNPNPALAFQRPRVAVDPAGDAIAVWTNDTGTNVVVEASTRPAGGAWQPAVVLSAAGQDASLPAVAVGRTGNALVVWTRSNGANTIVQAAAKPLGGPWQAPVDVSAPGQDATEPQVALDAQDDAVAVWSRKSGSDTIAQAASRPASSGVWQTPANLSAAGATAAGPQVAMDAQGVATAVWSRYDGSVEVVQSSSRSASGGAWPTPVNLTVVGATGRFPQLAVNAQGDAVAAWTGVTDTSFVTQASTRAGAGGAWAAPVNLSAGLDAQSPRVAIDAAGDAVAVWKGNSNADRVQAAVRPGSAQGWQAPADLSADGYRAGPPDVAIDDAGNATAVWARTTDGGAGAVIQSAGRGPTTPWRPPVDLSSTADQSATAPRVASDAQGNAAAVWRGSRSLQAAGYDAAGPLLAGATLPAGGDAGQSLSFAVTPFDVWSALGTTAWSFGDGTGATGAKVAHAYAAAGRFEAVVTATDVLGNATVLRRAVTIAAPPGPPGGPPSAAPGSPPPAGPVAVPAISHASLTAPRFRVGPRAAATVSARKAPQGTVIRFTLSAAAQLRVDVVRRRPGLRSRGGCVTPTAKLRAAHAKRCIRSVASGGVVVAHVAQGVDKVPFSGRVGGGKALSPGGYAATLTAASAAGRSKPVVLPFSIVR